MRKRSETEIVADILLASIGGTTKTKIMYRAFLCHEQLEKYLPSLIENRLLDYNNTSRSCSITVRGARFLTIFEKMIEDIAIKKER